MASCKSIRAEGGLNLSCSLSFMSCLKRPFSGRCVSIFSLKFVGVAVWVAVQHSSSLHYGKPLTGLADPTRRAGYQEQESPWQQSYVSNHHLKCLVNTPFLLAPRRFTPN